MAAGVASEYGHRASRQPQRRTEQLDEFPVGFVLDWRCPRTSRTPPVKPTTSLLWALGWTFSDNLV